jgi:bifunctional UDP-N-acetylglucosamine pyrophosphorylase / glucosamine-1-phosphate N-acetyltransferase
MIPEDAPKRTCLAIVLAAGQSKRMRSARPKVLHELAGRSLLAHVLASVSAAGAERVALVVGPDHDGVVKEARNIAPDIDIFIQAPPLGTAHAVLAAKAAIAVGYDDILVAFGDTPLVQPETFARLRAGLRAPGRAVVALGFLASDPRGYGRLIQEGDTLVAIREDRDLRDGEAEILFCNAGLMAIAGTTALALLESIDAANAQGEYYLTDIVAAARREGLSAVAIDAAEDEVLGINDRQQLAAAEAVLQARLRSQAMRGGVTFVDPNRVQLSYDTTFGRDVLVEPDVFFGPGVTVGDGVTIRAFSHLTGAEIGAGSLIGPFARLRPGTVLAADVHIGNFVEVKAASLGAGVKANHLAYIGDAVIGAKTNVGAGVITCNYDGFAKFRTEIGEGVFIGVNSALVAPVTIGDGAYIGTGSVITENVAPDALALARGRQVEKPGWAKAFRDKHKK